MLLGQEIILYQTKDKKRGRMNRMQHQMGHLQRSLDGAWIQGTLVSLGLARVRTSVSNPEMAAQLYILEIDARAKGIGLWALADYEVLNDSKIIETHLNRFQVVEGVVKEIASHQNRIFLNFGADWKTDFTLVVEPDDRRNFTKAGIDPLSWKGYRLRARGWLGFYNGPNMEITHPQRVEILKGVP